MVGIGPSTDAPKPMIAKMFRGLWKPYLVGTVIWIALLCALLYFRLAKGLPAAWYTPLLVGLILVGTLSSSLILPLWMRRLQRRVINAEGRICPNCLYDLQSLESAETCPECGWDIITEPPDVTWAKLLNRGKPLN